MKSITLEDIKLENTLLSEDVKKKLILSDIRNIAELSQYGVLNLINLEGILFEDVIQIKAVLLGDYNIHLTGEELVDYTDLFDVRRAKLVKSCNLMLNHRNFYRKLSINRKSNEELAITYKKRQEELDFMITNLLDKIMNLRAKKQNRKFSR